LYSKTAKSSLQILLKQLIAIDAIYGVSLISFKSFLNILGTKFKNSIFFPSLNTIGASTYDILLF
jgi:hypothetical protein